MVVMDSCWDSGLSGEEGALEKEREREEVGGERQASWTSTGRGARDLLGLASKRVWVVCLFLGIFVALFHLTALSSTYMVNPIRGWSSASQQITIDSTSYPVYKKARPHPRVAICLVGGARSFELTGLSIKEHVLDVYNNSDVFLHVPLDDDAHKLTLLQGASNLAMAKIFENENLPESMEAQEVLTGANSPNGIQGLLQYFRLVEGCLSMISSFETTHKFKFDWIIRTRVDGYWNGPLPPLGTFDPTYYHVPYGSKFGGFNDRFGVGSRNASWTALSRLSLIPKLYDKGFRDLNSETAFMHQMESSDIKVQFKDFPFCILTSRKYAWPLHKWGVPVASIQTKGALNGAKCKPCHAVVSGLAARDAIEVLDSGWGWINPVNELELCDGSQDVEPGWESIFDNNSGPMFARIRQKMSARNREECIQEVRQFGQSWEVWDAPSPEVLCRQYRV